MNIWGYCERCDVWFQCPTDHVVDWACPSCGVEPLRIENRTVNGSTGTDGDDRSHTAG
jgi:predicted RNA-binding Zn-ribbon protein involved in translation (DUF1610 family)